MPQVKSCLKVSHPQNCKCNLTQTSGTSSLINVLPIGYIKGKNGDPFQLLDVPASEPSRINYKDKNVQITYACSCCNNLVTDKLTATNDGYVCQSCYDDNYFTCGNCSEIHHYDDCVWGNTAYCSKDCANRRGWYECADCHTWTNRNYTNDNDDIICNNCCDNYTSCESCDCILHTANSYYRESSQQTLCQECYDENQDDTIIKNYEYKPASFLYSKMPWENTQYLGIELEVECPSDAVREDKAGLVLQWLEGRDLEKMVYIKADSSLDNGFEVVFMPMTLQAIHKKFPMKEFLDELVRLGLTSHNKGTCGLHVHISKKKMTSTDLYKGKLFFYRCQYWLKKFSARTTGNMNKDSAFHYCKFDSTIPENGTDNPYGHFSAINTSASCNTLEIRIFRGTIRYPRLLASLQFSDLFGEYIQSVGIGYMKNTGNADIWNDFIRYAKKSNKYNQFLKYVIKKGWV